MGSEREASFPIENFGGLNLNSDKEDMAPNQLLQAQNLWERTLGLLETRGGSRTVTYKKPGIVDHKIGNLHKIYKSWGEKNRFAAVQCTPDCGFGGNFADFPTGLIVRFATFSQAYWNKDHTYAAGTEPGITLNHTHKRLLVRLVGFGVDKWFEQPIATVTGYVAATAQQIQVVVDEDTFDNTKITGIELYVTTYSGLTNTPAAITTSSNYQEQTMWVGFVDVNKKFTVGGEIYKEFDASPFSFKTGIVANTVVSQTERSFVIKSYQSGKNGITGHLIGGKTYYVAVLPQWAKFAAGNSSRMAYRQPLCDVFGGEVVPITIPGSGTGYFVIEDIAPNTTCFLVAVGDNPQTLQPIQIYNDSEGLGDSRGQTNESATTLFPGGFVINKVHSGNPGVIDITYTDNGLATLSFRMSDYSRSDMFIGITDDDPAITRNTYPIFAGRQHFHVQDSSMWQDVLGSMDPDDPFYNNLDNSTPTSSCQYPWVQYSTNAYAQMQRMGSGADYCYVPWDNFALFVNDFDPLSLSDRAYALVPSRTNSNYYIIDGNVAAAVIEDAQYTTFTNRTTSGATAVIPYGLAKTWMVGVKVNVVSGTNFTVGAYTVISVVENVSLTLSSNYTTAAGNSGVYQIYIPSGTLPNARFITKFDSSIIIGGGTPSVDPVTLLRNDSAKTNYFTRALNPFDFTIPGAASATYQTVSVDDDGEDTRGYAIYTSTTSDQGPLSQLVTLKKNACWIMNRLPTYENGVPNVSSLTNRILSKKVGGYHFSVANTPIGTIVAGQDNVYLLREDGEPTPIGQGISNILIDADMSNAVACYHDRHYKLSFSHPNYNGYEGGAHNNIELWLNINKMIEMKGGEDWVGPMVGRGVDWVFVEDKDGDGDAYRLSRDRYAVDNFEGIGRIYRADVLPLINEDSIYDVKVTEGDLETRAITAAIETKDMDITTQDNNWSKLLKRFYIKCRTNWVATTNASANVTIFTDGILSGDKDFGLDVGNSAGNFFDRSLRLIRIFPVGRLNGRTFRFRFTFTKRVAIGGLQINYQVVRRRL